MPQNVLKDDNAKVRFANNPENKATNILFGKLDKLLQKEYVPLSCLSPTKDALKSPQKKIQPSGMTPIAKRTRKNKLKPQNNTLNQWLSKPKIDDNMIKKKPEKSGLHHKENDKSDACGSSSTKGKNNRPKFTRNSSNESFSDLPVFSSTRKTTKIIVKQRESDNKYGRLPKLEDILEEQSHLQEYRKQVTAAQTLEEPLFQTMTHSPQKKDKNANKTLLLDCKHLSFEELSEVFQENLKYLEDIISGKRYSERHKRYQNIGKSNYKQAADLTYNTSMIVFSFEQIDHLTTLLEEQFDPENNMSAYFFKVLLPELCLKIFMESHNMNKREANAYLDNRPVD